MALKAIVSIDLIALAYITISLGNVLIDCSLGGAMTIVYGICEAVNEYDGRATA